MAGTPRVLAADTKSCRVAVASCAACMLRMQMVNQGEGWQQLGKLGPDLDEERLEQLRAKQDRIREFAKLQREMASAALPKVQ